MAPSPALSFLSFLLFSGAVGALDIGKAFHSVTSLNPLRGILRGSKTSGQFPGSSKNLRNFAEQFTNPPSTTYRPSSQPSDSPAPSPSPSSAPTLTPPSASPTESPKPSPSPSTVPTQRMPTPSPTTGPPTRVPLPSATPTDSPAPSPAPSPGPTFPLPSMTPTDSPAPSPSPTGMTPTTGPTVSPVPSSSPSDSPAPSPVPSSSPTRGSSSVPSISRVPTSRPSDSPKPSPSPTGVPSSTLGPTISSDFPTTIPTVSNEPSISSEPSISGAPSQVPSFSAFPSVSNVPSLLPSMSNAPSVSDNPSTVLPSISFVPTVRVIGTSSTTSIAANSPSPTVATLANVGTVTFPSNAFNAATTAVVAAANADTTTTAQFTDTTQVFDPTTILSYVVTVTLSNSIQSGTATFTLDVQNAFANGVPSQHVIEAFANVPQSGNNLNGLTIFSLLTSTYDESAMTITFAVPAAAFSTSSLSGLNPSGSPQAVVTLASVPGTANRRRRRLSSGTCDANLMIFCPLRIGCGSILNAFSSSTTAPFDAVDFNAASGDAVVAALAGTVDEVGTSNPEYGRYVAIGHIDGSHTLYASLNSVTVAAGDSVSAMQQIGTAGISGNFVGVNRLHFQYAPSSLSNQGVNIRVDPVPCILNQPSVSPSSTPSLSHVPSASPSLFPSLAPSAAPSLTPSAVPSAVPSLTPSAVPSAVPSLSRVPSASPSLTPSAVPSAVPSLTPSAVPSAVPSLTPSAVPSAVPSLTSSAVPSAVPSLTPSAVPSLSRAPSHSHAPSLSHVPSASPSLTPTSNPSQSVQPSVTLVPTLKMA